MTIEGCGMADYGAMGRRCVDNGYAAIPIAPGDKAPGYASLDGHTVRLEGWQRFTHELPTDFEIGLWSRVQAGVGIVCGTVVGIDLDISEPELADRLELYVRRITGGKDAPVRYGNAPKRLLLFRAEGPVANLSRAWKVGTVQRGIDVLAGGRQFVSYGIHPKTSRPYTWDDNLGPADVPVDELPAITQAHVDQIVAMLMAEAGMPAPRVITPGTGLTAQATDEALAYFMSQMPNPEGWGWVDWNNMLGAVYNASGGSALGYQLARDWSMRNSKHNDRQFDDKWRTYASSPMTQVGFGTIVNRARELHIPPPPTDVRFRQENPNMPTLDLGAYASALPVQPAGISTNFTPAVTTEAWIEALQAEREEAEAEFSDNAVTYGGLTVRMSPVRKPLPPRESTIAPPGLIAEFAEWYSVTAPVRIPEYAVMSGVALVSTLLGRIVKAPSGVRPAVFALLIGPSASGKNHGRDLISKAMTATGILAQHDIGSNVTSGAALRAAFVRAAGGEPNTSTADHEPDGTSMSKLLMSDEFGKFWSQHNGKEQSGNSASLMGDLMSIYSAGDIVWSGTAKAGEDAKRIPYPALTILGMSTPQAFFERLNEETLRQGHVNRFLLCEAAHTEHRSAEELARFYQGHRVPKDVPTAVVTTMHALQQWAAQHSLVHNPWIDYASEVEITDEAAGYLSNIKMLEIKCEQYADKNKTVVHETFGRMAENTIRLALICAASRITEKLKTESDGRLVPLLPLKITVNDVAWAWEIVRYSCERFAHVIAKELNAGTTKHTDKMLRIIEAKGASGIRRGSLMQLTGFQKTQFDNIAATLIDRGSIIAVPTKPEGGGRPGTVYFASDFAADAAKTGSIETNGAAVTATPKARRKQKQRRDEPALAH